MVNYKCSTIGCDGDFDDIELYGRSEFHGNLLMWYHCPKCAKDTGICEDTFKIKSTDISNVPA